MLTMSRKMVQEADLFSEVDSLESISGGSGSGSGSGSNLAMRRKRKRVNNLFLTVSEGPYSFNLPSPVPLTGRQDQPCQPQENGDSNVFHYIVQQGARRKSCEDKCHVDLQNLYFSIFDGHGGVEAAEFASSTLCKKIVYDQQPARDAFIETDSELIESLALSGTSSDVCGTTALTAIVVNGKLQIAHVGDSRAVLVRGNRGKSLTRDHHPSVESEAARIEGKKLPDHTYFSGEPRIDRCRFFLRPLFRPPNSKRRLYSPKQSERYYCGLKGTWGQLTEAGGDPRARGGRDSPRTPRSGFPCPRH